MFKVGDLVKPRIYSDAGGDEDCEFVHAGEAGLITEVCDFGTHHNPIYSVTFPDNTVAPYYQSDLEVVSERI